ncbi:hypothetical protein [Micromonospora sp. NPDC047730]|uniref:hypothetical protein n=1 Tax=Micromonospora sp. NPDC047730 TaxID=3364253 RepID=UPI00371E5409
MAAIVFPAAAPGDDVHPAWCACRGCTDRQVTALSRPLVQPGARRDQALDRRRRGAR